METGALGVEHSGTYPQFIEKWFPTVHGGETTLNFTGRETMDRNEPLRL